MKDTPPILCGIFGLPKPVNTIFLHVTLRYYRVGQRKWLSHCFAGAGQCEIRDGRGFEFHHMPKLWTSPLMLANINRTNIFSAFCFVSSPRKFTPGLAARLSRIDGWQQKSHRRTCGFGRLDLNGRKIKQLSQSVCYFSNLKTSLFFVSSMLL